MIEFESVTKTYRDGTTAVEDLSLQIPSDKITVIVGPSGCGKTTTLRMINRMLEPTQGRIVWDGEPLRSKRRTQLRRQMGYVIQNGGLFPHRSVIDNVTTVPSLLGWDRAKSRTRALELLDAVGLERRLVERYPAQLSGGQQQRVGVARALAADPIVLLMDEPFSAVDPVVRADLHELMLDLQRELSKTIVMITHDIDEAIKLGDQVAILRVGGKLAQVGTPQQLLDEPADSFVEGFVGRDRGYRALSFAPADGLQLERVRAVRDASSATGGEPTLVLDADAKPVGWADPARPGQLHGLGLGSTFDPHVDTLRVALDSALTSPVGLAVAVSQQTGRYAGVVAASAILSQVNESRAAMSDEISTRRDRARSDEASEPGATGEVETVDASGDPNEQVAPVTTDHDQSAPDDERSREQDMNDETTTEPTAEQRDHDQDQLDQDQQDQGQQDQGQQDQIEAVPDPTVQSDQEPEGDHPTLIRAPVDVPPEDQPGHGAGPDQPREEPR